MQGPNRPSLGPVSPGLCRGRGLTDCPPQSAQDSRSVCCCPLGLFIAPPSRARGSWFKTLQPVTLGLKPWTGDVVLPTEDFALVFSVISFLSALYSVSQMHCGSLVECPPRARAWVTGDGKQWRDLLGRKTRAKHPPPEKFLSLGSGTYLMKETKTKRQ